MSELAYRRWLRAIVATSILAGLVGIGWGIPNGNQTWAADSVAPMTPLAVAYHLFGENGFDSGYFFFKYPVGHQLLLAALSAPVLGVALVMGDLGAIQSDYPFGFSSPEVFLSVLAITMRLVSVVMGTGLLVLIAGIARRSVNRIAGVAAAFIAAGCYPLLFYQHTSNVEVAYLFWAFLALYAMIRGLGGGSPRWYWLLGASAAMAVSTKEQIAGFLVPLPAVLLAVHWHEQWFCGRGPGERGGGLRRVLPEGAVVGGILSLAVLLGVNAAWFNPSGFVNRLRFLTHTLDPNVRRLYASYEFPIDFSTRWTLDNEIAHAGNTGAAIVSSIGWPALVLALAGLVWMSVKHRRALLYVLAALAGYYLFSLRLLKQVEIRYTLALSLLAAVPAGVFAGWLWQNVARARVAVAAVVVGGLLYSGEVLAMLVGDPRYDVERWMQPYLESGRTVEVYQSWTYLPRWKRVPGVRKVAFDDIHVAVVRERAPDFIVLSSKGLQGVTMYPNPDWRDGRGMMLEAPENRRFLDALMSGELGYERVAAFEHPLLFDRTLITSLNPAITIYRRMGLAR